MVPTAAEVQRLEGELQQCVAALQFEAAATLRDRLQALKAELAAGEAEVRRMEAELQQHVVALEFEAAARLRDRIKALRSSLGAPSITAGEKTARQDGAKTQEQTMGTEREEKGQDGARTVSILRLPVGTTEVQLKARFPTAQGIQLYGKKENHISALVEFGTVAEAETVAKQGQLDVADTIVKVRMAGERGRPLPESERQKQEEETRTVFVGRLPLSTKDTDLWQHFPAAVEVSLHRGSSYSFAFVLFRSVAEAEAAAAQGKVQVGSETGLLEMAADRNAMNSQKQDETSRTLVLSGLPLETGEVQVRQHFPTVEAIRIVPGKHRSTGFVTFATAKEAQSFATRTCVEIAGHSVFVYMKGQSIQSLREEEETRTVFICRLPLATTKAELQQHFPAAAHITVRQGKFASFAFVMFRTVAEAEVAASGTILVGGKPTAVVMAGPKGSTERCRIEEKDRTVHLARLSPETTQADLEQSFPTAESIRIVCKGSRTFAFVTFPDAEEALAVAQQAEVAVAGQTVAVCMGDHRCGPKRPTTETPLAAKRSKSSPVGS